MESHPINDIFATALEIESERSRQKYLDEVCAENVALRAKVEQLLSDHQKESASGSDNSENFRTVEYSKPIGTAGSVVGPYKLLQQIGEGGMGSVWMAEQEHPVRRMVALKIIKAGMDSKQVIARFEAERQALADESS